MAGQGDLNLARELRAEFGKAKQPRRRGRGREGGDHIFQVPSESQLQYQLSHRNEHTGFNQGRGRIQDRGGARPLIRSSRPAWQGQLITNDSPGNNRISSHPAEANMFFHQPSRAPPPTPPAFTQDATPLTPSFQQSNSHWPGLNNAIGPLNPINHDSAATPGMPWHQATNTIPLTPIAPLQENRRPCAEQGEQEEEDIEMENSDYLSATTSKPVATDTSKGLAGSMWNPANRNTSANSVDGSQTLFEAGPDTTKKAPMVISGITKGPGLKASRWCG